MLTSSEVAVLLVFGMMTRSTGRLLVGWDDGELTTAGDDVVNEDTDAGVVAATVPPLAAVNIPCKWNTA